MPKMNKNGNTKVNGNSGDGNSGNGNNEIEILNGNTKVGGNNGDGKNVKATVKATNENNGNN